MTLHYRETDAVSARWTGNTGGVKLSAAQADENIYTLDARITATQAMITASRGIVSITTSMGELTFHMSDSTLEGPIPIPGLTLHGREAWAPLTDYSTNETFYINGTVYLVEFPHTSGLTFDAGANDGMGHNYYSVMVPNPGNALATGGSVGMVYVKSSSADFAATWRFLSATEVSFTPSTASGLTSTNVSDALEEIESRLGATRLRDLTDVDIVATPAIGNVLQFVADTSGDNWQDVPPSWLPLSGGTLTGALTLAADPASALQPATKQYVDNLLQGLNPKTAVLCATTANITLSGEQTIDGVTTSASRVLVKNQTTAAQNGIYLSGAGAWTRVADMDAWGEVPAAYVFVEEGTASADTGWVCSSDPGGTLGTTAVNWVKFTAASAAALSGLSDVNVSEGSGIDGYTLNWNNSSGKWVATAPVAGGAATLHSLSDVNVTEGSGIDGYVLYWKNADGKWEAKQLATVATSGAYSDLSGLPTLGTAAALATMTAAQYRANTASKVLTTDTVWSAATAVALTDAATVTMDFSTFINATLTGTGGVGASRTLGAASNAKPGQSGIIEWFPVTGALTLVIPTGSSYVAAGGVSTLVLSNTNGARDAIAYSVLSDGKILLSVQKAVAT